MPSRQSRSVAAADPHPATQAAPKARRRAAPRQPSPKAPSLTPAPDEATPLLGGLSPAQFMARHWQKQPLLVRQALPGVRPPVTRDEAFALAARAEVESRLVVRSGRGRAQAWSLDHGPLPRRRLPPLSQPGWTVLVQGLNQWVPAADELLGRFRFVPQARLDDLMVSWATEGGGVGPHFDSYDVFLIQVEGRRRWRIGRMPDARLRKRVPLKLIANFRAEEEHVLEPGDMLYLPPRWAHDGDAVDGPCMTCSVGFRSPAREELLREVLLRLADEADDRLAEAGADAGARPDGDRYADPVQPAVATPGRLPEALLGFAREGLEALLADPAVLSRALGEVLSEPKPSVSFVPANGPAGRRALQQAARLGVQLAGAAILLYDADHVYFNGEAWRVAGQDGRDLRELADRRVWTADRVATLSAGLREQLAAWLACGWLRPGH
jgi:50S ribosomal protein L16 3-hydroxylase